MHWNVEVSGESRILNAISASDEEGVRHIEEREGKFFLPSQLFRECMNPSEVRRVADDFLFGLNRFALTAMGAARKICCADLRSTDPDGVRTVHVLIQDALTCSAELSGGSLQDADGTIHRFVIQAPRVFGLSAWLRLLASSENLRKVERLLEEQPHDWTNLYRVIEVIESDVGGKRRFIKDNYSDQKTRDRFGHSANHPAAAGDQARHGHMAGPPPGLPMDLSEARVYVHEVRRQWIKRKLSSK